MCLNSGGKMTTDKIFFKKFLEGGGEMTEGITVIRNFTLSY